jgi:hypothetical protein
MANAPPFATLNHFAADLGIPSESELPRVGIRVKGHKAFEGFLKKMVKIKEEQGR